MNPNRFNIRSRIKRSVFTTVFGSVGRRRRLPDFNSKPKIRVLRFKMICIRRSNQGYRNRIIGAINAIKLRLKYGRRPTVPKFRR
jgi:hypothetical protein